MTPTEALRHFSANHRAETADPHWFFMYGRLTADLMARSPYSPVNTTSTAYADLIGLGATQHAPPAGFAGGNVSVDGGVFVPFDPQLRPTPGYIIAPGFWAYINRTDLFPAGWLHDVGLPLTDAFTTEAIEVGQARTIVMQAFERSVLTFDPRNPADWQIERGNLGSNALLASADHRGNPPDRSGSPLICPINGCTPTRASK